MSQFKEISTKEFKLNPFDIKNAWMLITASKPDGSVNTMTASWGGFGVMWNKEIAWVVIRPQRYTKEFVDVNESFSLTFFNKSYKKQLGYLGKVSGRDEDKIAQSNLTLLSHNGVPYFEEAEAAVFARKLYAQPLGEEFFIDTRPIADWYPEKDYHMLYMAEITGIIKKEETLLEDLDNILL